MTRARSVAALLGLAASLALPGSGGAASPSAGVVQGPLVALSAATGKLQPFPRVRGRSVYAIADDGRGGWFVGGEFSSIGGIGCRNLAHVGSDRSVDRSWCPRPDGTVRALARAGALLYVGGEGMHRIAGKPRTALAALEISSGRATAWNPGTPGATFGVQHLAVDERRGVLYVTGEFSRVGGKERHRLAAVRLRRGTATPFAPEPDETFHGDSVLGTAPAPTGVFAWGFFGRIGGKPRDGFAKLDPASGRALPFDPAPICPTKVVASGARLYVGTSVGCEGAKGPLLAFALTGGRPAGWKPPALPRISLEALGATPTLVVAVVAPSRFHPGPRLVAGLDERGGRLFTSPVHPLDDVEAVEISGGLVLLGGSFQTLR
jgi:hypothetical protein